MDIEVMVIGGEDGKLPSDGQLLATVLTTVDGVQEATGPTGVVEQEPKLVTVVAAQLGHEPPTLIVLVPQDVIGVQVPVLIGETGEVGAAEQVSMVEMLVIVIGGIVDGEQVPTPPTGELDGQLGVSVSVIVKASHVPLLPQVETPPDPYVPQEVAEAEAARGTTGLATARMLRSC
jgi:hypothetical protein